MILISEKSIATAEAFFEVLNEREASEISIRFAVEQPYLLIYLQSMAALDDAEEDESNGAADEDEEEESDEELIAEELQYYAMVLWKAFELEAGKIALITEQEIEVISETSMLELQQLLGDTAEADPVAMAGQFRKMKQPILVAYLLSTFFGDEDDEDFDPEFQDEASNYLFLVCNQVIMMLDEKVNGTPLRVVE